jgi:two-component system cell cycle response regulator
MTARVLVVDDVPLNVKVLAVKLGSEYYDVVTAGSGAEALAIVAKERPDIVLLDVMMPGIDGFEVCRRLKGDPLAAHIPIVMVTALGEQEHRLQGLAVGADDFLTKPVDDLTLFARVRSLVRLKQMTDELRLREQASRDLGFSQGIREIAIEGVRALLVTEHAAEGDRLASALGADWQVQVVADADRAFAQASAENFDVIAIDIGSRFDSLKLCAQLRGIEELRPVPILLLVASADRARLIKALDIGITDYVTRPIDSHEFVARMRAQAKRKRYQDLLRQSFREHVMLAVRDALTGVFNRRYLASHIAAALSQGAGHRSNWLLVLDIDFFKTVNDRFGHLVGDEVLKEFARRLMENVRGVDVVCRLGGEEFVVVMPDADPAGIRRAAERLRRGIAEIPFRVPGLDQPLTVTCSIGVSAAALGESLDPVLERADKALYQAKHAGRNQVCLAPSADVAAAKAATVGE